ncbi:Putative heterokaryon incompatibility [Septoria linicola]|uniref:Heterokaryon incompatibility n=1 Tax=Septoria linicola TaxID=215465 RepID=A0A9Q9EIQ7_9PEZI|nr:putative heterokaryon incompatibility [Septoria linicola]USW51302.1 Putative heterokaryon incompatibility [Septoria linicola]
MWLLNARTKELVKCDDEVTIYGRYAILSHVWGKEEVTFQDIEHNVSGLKQKRGYAKIERACQQALSEKLEFLWVDTCCINKLSSAELSEAINSMYRWYYEAKVCYAYLVDVPVVDLRSSKWFTRGWTLQELIAPGFVEFYDSTWRSIGNKFDMLVELASITSIDINVLRDRSTLKSTSVAARLAWAANRQTSKKEDEAYSLMGIFDVNMPMIYGEGSKAFARLQEEIIKTYEDPSILAWQAWEQDQASMLLSPSPKGFRKAHNILSWSYDWIDDSFALQNKGLRIYLPVVEDESDPMRITAILNCRYQDESTKQIALLLKKHPPGMIVPKRELKATVCEMAPKNNSKGAFTSLKNLDRKFLPSAKWQNLMILKSPTNPDNVAPASIWEQKIRVRNYVQQLSLTNVHPKEAWSPQDDSITLVITGSPENDRGYMTFDEHEGKKKFSLIFAQQEANSGRAEPRVWLSKHGPITDETSWYKTLSRDQPQQCARIAFKKGVTGMDREDVVGVLLAVV